MRQRGYIVLLTVVFGVACHLVLLGVNTHQRFLAAITGGGAAASLPPNGGSIVTRVVVVDNEQHGPTSPTNQTQNHRHYQFTFPVFPVNSTSSSHSTIKSKLLPKPAPLMVLEQYLEWHSVDSLRREPHHRTYSVVFYSCPLQAGNRLHHFLAGMYWSIVTNRTMLWKYWDTESCARYGADYNPLICQEANTVKDCDPILARAPWIPSYDDWRDTLGLPEPLALPFHSTHPQHIPNFRYPWGPGNDATVQGVDVTYRHEPLVLFNQTRNMLRFMGKAINAHLLLQSPWSRAINYQLYNQGPEFLFGMLQMYSFDLTDPIKASVPTSAYKFQDLSRYYTVALHSRHIAESDDGCNVTREQRCLEELSSQSQKTNRNCVVSLMSDRACTLDVLTPWLNARGCDVLVAEHERRSDFLSEHGPFAGAGFFQDLALASTARSAFVGMVRSSSDLVMERLVFLRKMEAWQDAAAVTAAATEGGANNGTTVDVERAVNEARVEFCRLDGPKQGPQQKILTPPAVSQAI